MTENGGQVAAEKTLTLAGKLAQIMAEVGRVPKNGRNDFHKYDYVTEADLVDAVRAKLAERNVVLLPALTSVNIDGQVTTAQMRFQFIDGDTGETFGSDWAGTGEDKGDKGLYKAYTGALKYFLMKSFLIATGDDPERDTTHDKARTKQVPKPKPKPAPVLTPEEQEFRSTVVHVAKQALDGEVITSKELLGQAVALGATDTGSITKAIESMPHEGAESLGEMLSEAIAEQMKAAA